jgi:hypothetical protein
VLFLGSIAAGVALLFAIALTSGPTQANAFRRVTIHEGDTVWRVAEKWSEQGSDTPRMVAAIESANSLRDGHLTPGETLLVPVTSTDAHQLAFRE